MRQRTCSASRGEVASADDVSRPEPTSRKMETRMRQRDLGVNMQSAAAQRANPTVQGVTQMPAHPASQFSCPATRFPSMIAAISATATLVSTSRRAILTSGPCRTGFVGSDFSALIPCSSLGDRRVARSALHNWGLR